MKRIPLLSLLCLSAFAQSVNYAPATVALANEGVTGTTTAKLVKCTGAPCTAIIATTSDTLGILGVAVSGAGTTGSVKYAPIHGPGVVPLVIDGATTAGDLIIASTTAGGSGHDSGVAAGGTCPSAQIIGVVLSTNIGAGTYNVALGSTCAAGGSGSTPRYGQILSGDGTVTGLPITDFVEYDDFCGGTANSGNIGKLNWTITAATGGLNALADTAFAGHPCYLWMETLGTAGFVAVSIGTGSSGYTPFQNLAAIGNWEMVYIVRPITSVDSNTTIRVGVGDVNVATTGIKLTAGSYMVELDSGNSTPGNFYLKTCDISSTCVAADTGVAPATGHWYKVRIWSDIAGTVKAEVSTDGGAYNTSGASATTGVTTNHTRTTSPIIYIETKTSSNRDMYVDFAGWRFSGMGR